MRWKLTTRRTMLLVAGSAVLLAGLHGGRVPGLYYPLGSLRAGVCRDGGDLAHERDGWHPAYLAGVWPAGNPREAIYGLHYQAGRVTARLLPGSGWEAW